MNETIKINKQNWKVFARPINQEATIGLKEYLRHRGCRVRIIKRKNHYVVAYRG